MSPAPLQEQTNGTHDGAGSKQMQSTTGTIPKAGAKTNRQRMSTMAAEAASANDAGGGGSLDGCGEDARARDGADESAVGAGGEMRYGYGDSEQDLHMPPPMADLPTERLRIRQDNPSWHHHCHHLHQQQQQPWRTNTAEQTAEMNDGCSEAEGGSVGSAGRRRQLLDSIPSQQIIMVRKTTRSHPSVMRRDICFIFRIISPACKSGFHMQRPQMASWREVEEMTMKT